MSGCGNSNCPCGSDCKCGNSCTCGETEVQNVSGVEGFECDKPGCQCGPSCSCNPCGCSSS